MQPKISTKPPITIPAIAPPFNTTGAAAAPAAATGAILGFCVGGPTGIPVTPGTVGSIVGFGVGRDVGLLKKQQLRYRK